MMKGNDMEDKRLGFGPQLSDGTCADDIYIAAFPRNGLPQDEVWKVTGRQRKLRRVSPELRAEVLDKVPFAAKHLRDRKGAPPATDGEAA